MITEQIERRDTEIDRNDYNFEVWKEVVVNRKQSRDLVECSLDRNSLKKET